MTFKFKKVEIPNPYLHTYMVTSGTIYKITKVKPYIDGDFHITYHRISAGDESGVYCPGTNYLLSDFLNCVKENSYTIISPKDPRIPEILKNYVII